jgi:C4-type Zn-finger protein
MSKLQCPHCQETRITRSRRRGLVEWLLRAICRYPFRCDICGYRFMRFRLRGHEDPGQYNQRPHVP